MTSEQTGFGYFRNFGETRRQGIELGVNGARSAASTFGAGYTFLDATFQSEETVNGESNGIERRGRGRVNQGSRARSRSSPAIACRSSRAI